MSDHQSRLKAASRQETRQREEGSTSRKILRFANGIYPDIVGGIEVNVARISAMQAERGHDVEVFLPRHREVTTVHDHPFPVHYYDPGPVVFGNPLNSVPYRMIRSRRGEVDVVHAHSHLYSGSNQAALACKRFDIPFVLTNEGMYSQTAPLLVQRLFMRSVGKFTFDAADRIITFSSQEADAMQQLGVAAEKIRVVRQGIDTEFFHPLPKENDVPRLLWVGRHVPGKGVDLLVKAVKLLEGRGIETHLDLVGRGPDKARIETMVRDLGLTERVTLRDFVSEEELHRLYAEADLFLLVSVSEAMNRSVLEALSSGTPALTSDLPHLVPLLEGCGATISDRTPSNVADTIEGLLSQDLIAMGLVGRQKVETEHPWSRALADVDAVFEDLLA